MLITSHKKMSIPDCSPLTTTAYGKEFNLQFSGLSFKTKDAKGESNVINNVSGRFNSGRLSAIIGPSGAGKTSLLNILTGFKRSRVKGSIQINGVKQNIDEFRQLSSYIPQDFNMLSELTTLETLEFAADLKLDPKCSRQSKRKLIQSILEILNLTKCCNVYVCRLSGGERKRLSIGVELITNPPIMFFDEPTSGLDSVSSIQVLQHLHDLAHSGRVIICVIHQPSSRLLKLFDDVCVLADGQCIYNGALDVMLPTFESFGLVCPMYYNPADFALEIASKEHKSDLSELIQAHERKFSSMDLTEVISSESEKTPIISNGNCFSEDKHWMLSKTHRKYPISWLQQFGILTRRSMLANFRNFLCVQMRVIAHVLIGLLLGSVFWDIGRTADTVLSNTSCIFFILMFIFYGNALPTVLTFPLETSVFLREYLNNWYSIGAYYFAKFISDIPLQFICPTLFVTIGYFLTGQPHDYGRFLMFWGICLLTSLLSQTIGLVAGAAFGLQLGIFLVPALSIPMLVFSGFFIRFHELFECMKPLTHITYFRYSFEGAIHAIYGYNRSLTCSKSAFCYFKTSEKLLQNLDMTGDRYGYDVAALVIWIVTLQAILYASLCIKVRRYQ